MTSDPIYGQWYESGYLIQIDGEWFAGPPARVCEANGYTYIDVWGVPPTRWWNAGKPDLKMMVDLSRPVTEEDILKMEFVSGKGYPRIQEEDDRRGDRIQDEGLDQNDQGRKPAEESL